MNAQQHVIAAGGPLPGTNLVEYLFPLREDFIARLVLPRDLTLDEVKRLDEFLNSVLHQEYEITQAMLDAGSYELTDYEPDFSSDEAMVRRIFLAMMKARNGIITFPPGWGEATVNNNETPRSINPEMQTKS